MLIELDRGGTCNRILQALSDDDFSLVSGQLTRVTLPIRKKLEAPHKSIDTVYFLDSGLASIVANGPQECSICVGLVGSEGATGLPVIFGTDRSPNETTIQFAGEARQISAGHLRAAMAKSATLQAVLLSYGHALTNQIAQTALANGWNTIEQRLARWLCMVHDRSDNDDLIVTHERLGELLGVRRPAITVALARLEQDRSIHVRRGSIAIVDRLRLEEKTGGMYGRSERELERLFSYHDADEDSGGRAGRKNGILDLGYYSSERSKSLQRIAKAETLCIRQRESIARLERDGVSSFQGRSLLVMMESSLEIMRKHLARTERAIDLERARER